MPGFALTSCINATGVLRARTKQEPVETQAPLKKSCEGEQVNRFIPRGGAADTKGKKKRRGHQEAGKDVSLQEQARGWA